MGSKNGKYDFATVGSVTHRTINETLPTWSSDLNGSVINRKLPMSPGVHRQIETNQVERFSLVWLDTEVYRRPSNIDMEIKLKNLIDYVRLFDRVDLCERYIKQIGKYNNNLQIPKESLLVVISTTLGPTLIPYIHDLSQVKSIYVYGKAKSLAKDHQRRLMKFTKVSEFVSFFFRSHSMNQPVFLLFFLAQRHFFIISNFDWSNITRSERSLTSSFSSKDF